MNKKARERLFVGVSGAVAVAALTIGFLRLGPPQRQRAFENDRLRTQDLHRISMVINRQQIAPADRRPPMPRSLAELRASAPSVEITDPVTRQPYSYRLLAGQQYELCATFETKTSDSLDRPQRGAEAGFWTHPAGPYCYRMDAGQPPVWPGS